MIKNERDVDFTNEDRGRERIRKDIQRKIILRQKQNKERIRRG